MISKKQHVSPIINIFSLFQWNYSTETLEKKEFLDIEHGTFSSHSDDVIDSEEKLKYILFVKDKFSLSDEAYHELSMLYSDLPRLHKMKTASRTLDELSKISIIPEYGVQQSLEAYWAVCTVPMSYCMSYCPPCPIVILSYCHTVPLSYCHTVT